MFTQREQTVLGVYDVELSLINLRQVFAKFSSRTCRNLSKTCSLYNTMLTGLREYSTKSQEPFFRNVQQYF